MRETEREKVREHLRGGRDVEGVIMRNSLQFAIDCSEAVRVRPIRG